MPGRDDPAGLAAAVADGGRGALSRAITLVESTRADDRAAARELLGTLTPPATPAVRVGISGVPGAGKSTLVETLGMQLIEQGHRIGVLAVDPSSTRTGGSVLGDKTRMPKLAAHRDAYVRPSPSAGSLGGVARATAQAIPLLEAAGCDVVLVETVGVGQSETTVAGMVDTFLLLALARSGDQLQGIKKGVLEIADVVAVNKADGSHEVEAKAAARELTGALHLVQGAGRMPTVLTCSGATGAGVPGLWQRILRHRDELGSEGLQTKRAEQRVTLAWALVRDELDQRLRRSAAVRAARGDVESAVRDGSLSAAGAADALLEAFDG
ncbi:methylmalonyl Co-A mutase-associated GTPase MeaB [Nakamurella sp. YIM 132087]|uniref:Methylmalonyl Co-A mutase-associated GTPase MeaB n=1 Tax=Nakamurella alba TaxID=2665158 RepID=A0A7K1FJ95_9ACTN|nr:methylmalonyl Co-A mutase-associated GTPase MeaB [Nakamurella alba]